MKKYKVQYSEYYEVIVDAESMDEAIEKVKKDPEDAMLVAVDGYSVSLVSNDR